MLRYIHRAIGDTEVYFVANPEPSVVNAVASFRVTGRMPELWLPETGRIEPVRVFTESGGCTHIPLRLEPAGSAFVVFRTGKVGDSARIVSVRCGGQELVKGSAADQPSIDPVMLEAFRDGTYDVETADGKVRQEKVAGLPQQVAVDGAWEVSFAPGWGAPAKVVMDKLVSWSEHSDAGVKYFSGSAVYRKVFGYASMPPAELAGKARIYLDLGKVAVMAEVKLNGKNLGILWKAPYRVDVTDAIKSGENVLETKVVNLWVNRLIGDEQLPEDSERNGDGTLKKWPQWLEDGKPSPAGRFTFTSWRLWKKGEALQESGLLGPVTLNTSVRMSAE
jgi:hypothetical protein